MPNTTAPKIELVFHPGAAPVDIQVLATEMLHCRHSIEWAGLDSDICAKRDARLAHARECAGYKAWRHRQRQKHRAKRQRRNRRRRLSRESMDRYLSVAPPRKEIRYAQTCDQAATPAPVLLAKDQPPCAHVAVGPGRLSPLGARIAARRAAEPSARLVSKGEAALPSGTAPSRPQRRSADPASCP